MKKIIRVVTIPNSFGGLLKGQLKFMTSYFDVIGISSYEALVGTKVNLDKVVKTENIRVFPVEMTRKITPIKDLKAVYNLYKILKKEKPEIVHSHTPKAGTIAMLAAKLAGTPNRLHTIAGLPLLEATGAKRILLDAVEKFTYACATKIYPNSNGQYTIIQELGYAKASKLKVIGNGSSNGIDTSHFNPSLYEEKQNEQLRKELNYNNDDFIFVFVGRLVTDKGINELVKSFTVLSKDYPKAKLLLLGTHEKELDPLLPETDKQIEMHPNIHCTGWVTDVRPYLAMSNALVFPSYREGFPNVVMQAGAMSLPSIVSDINGCNEIVNHEFNGHIIPPKNSEVLIEAMKYFLDNPKLVESMAKVARKTICDNYERTFVWQELLKEYNQLLSN